MALNILCLWTWMRGSRTGLGKLNGYRGEPRKKRIAIFVPLWHEHGVIGRHGGPQTFSRDQLRQLSLLYIGAYPNDEPTLDAVRQLESRFSTRASWPSVRTMVPHPKPTA